MGRETEKKIEVEKIKKLGWVIPISILIMGLIFLGGFLPVFYDFSQMQTVVKILFIACYIVGLGLLITLVFYDKTEQNEEKNSWKDKVFIGFLSAIYIIGFLMFFDHDLWGYKDTVYGVLFLIVLFVEIFMSVNMALGKRLASEKLPTILISAAVLTFILAAVNETSNNVEPANLLYKLSFGIAYLVTVALFINSYLFKKRDSSKTIGNIVGIVFWGSLILTTFPYYVQWCGLKDDNFQTFVTVYAALIGGGITLAGVAWTIKDSNDKRKEDLQRVEMERKEEERKKNIPYLMLANDSITPNIARITETNNLNFSKATDVSKIKDDTYYVIKINPFNVKNVSRSNAVLKGIYIDEVYHKFAHNILIEKDGLCQIQVGINHWFAFPKKVSSVRLLITDTLFNEYTVECEMYKRQDDKPQKNVAPNGIEYNVCSYVYIAETLLLPDYKMEDKLDE